MGFAQFNDVTAPILVGIICRLMFA